jgi:pyruvate dehydrogenase E1 component alpha subunit
MGHSMADPIHGHYRTKEELEEQKQKDPIEQMRKRLTDADLLDDDRFAALEENVMEEVQDALDFADESPEPDADALYTDVYAD